MSKRWMGLLVLTTILVLFVTACDTPPPAANTPLPPLIVTATPSATPPNANPTGVAKTAPPVANPTGAIPTVAGRTATPPPVATTVLASPTAAAKAALTCPAPVALPANTQLAARVNGQGISLDLYNRQVTQAQNAFVAQGIDPKSAGGQEAIKSLRQQVLDQMINEVVIAQQAEKEGIKVTDNDVNARLAQMIQDAGSVDKLNKYLSDNQLTLADFCMQIRNNILGDAMLTRITAALPTQVEQVHVRQILVSTAALAQTLRDRARKGEDFAALAKQYSMDETSKANGGDLGWVPKGVLAPELDAVIFQLAPNQISDVITTQFGFHIVQVLEKDKSRALPPEMIQNARQQAFLAWLQAVREGMKIERFVQ